MRPCPHETFPALSALPVIHAFTQRGPGLDVKTDRETALARLENPHAELRVSLGLGARHFITAEQIHSANVAIVRADTPTPVLGVDALISDDPRVCLGIYVADCAPVWLVDPVRRAIGCVHSGKKGTELGIVTATIARMVAEFGCEPARMVAQIGPCIRPPHYENDFAAEILRQCHAAGIGQIHDCGTCTAENVARYYSYRLEKGQTGRMVALISLAQTRSVSHFGTSF